MKPENNVFSESPIAQLIEVGLVARYARANDFEGLQKARNAVREELLRKGWTLPPYTHEHERAVR